jgi:hypothetical protein
MDIYKQAVMLGLRFTTTKGSLNTEQLYQLTQTDLTNSIRNQKKVLKKTDDDELGFLDEMSRVDATEQLKFDILKDVYLTKKAQNDALRTAREVKEHNQKILNLISEKQEESLKGKTLEELTAMLRD